MGIFIVHLPKLHCIIVNLLFFWFTKRKKNNTLLMSFCRQILCTIARTLSFIFIAGVLHTSVSYYTSPALCKSFAFSSTCFSSDKRYVLAECVWSTWNLSQMLPRNFSLARVITTLLFDLITPKKLFHCDQTVALQIILNLKNFTLGQGLGNFMNCNVTMDLSSSQKNVSLIYILQCN